MKTLVLQRNEKTGQVTVQCADGEVSVYSHCEYCRHCAGVRVGKRVIPSPITQALKEVKRGTSPDESLMNAAMMFNTLVRDGSSLECGDVENRGFKRLF